MSLMSSSLLLQLCPACLVHLTWIVFMMGGRWLYNCCLVGCCLHLFNTAHSILVSLPSSFFSIHLISVRVVHPYSSIDMTTAYKKLHFILSVQSDFHMTDSLSITVHAFASHILTSFSVDETLLPRQVNLSISFRELPLSVEMSLIKAHVFHLVCYASSCSFHTIQKEFQPGQLYLPEALCCRRL